LTKRHDVNEKISRFQIGLAKEMLTVELPVGVYYVRGERHRELGIQFRETDGKPTIVCDVILPMGQLPTKGIPEVFEGEPHSKSLGYVRDDPISEERPRFRLGTVTDGEDLEHHLEWAQGHKKGTF
jgi:hypothetical protein